MSFSKTQKFYEVSVNEIMSIANPENLTDIVAEIGEIFQGGKKKVN